VQIVRAGQAAGNAILGGQHFHKPPENTKHAALRAPQRSRPTNIAGGPQHRAAPAYTTAFQSDKKEGSSSFLKKRTKKLLSIAGGTILAHLDRAPDAISKSFLLLFFKKEGLLFISAFFTARAAMEAACDLGPLARQYIGA
jgi:hypothetical protein